MNELKISRYSSSAEAAVFAGRTLNKHLAGNKDEPVLLVLSAGSSFEILNEISAGALSPHLTISMLDERFSLDAKINNFSQLQKTPFYQLAQDSHCNFFGTAVRPKESIEEFSARWGNRLRDWTTENPQGKIFASFGMGPDGHIAGMFPYPENPKKFDETFLGNNWLASYFALGKHLYPERVTMTPAFFMIIDAAVAYICGTEKKPAFQKLLAKTASLAELPAMALYDIKNLEIYTDIG